MTYGNRLYVNDLQDDQESEVRQCHANVKSSGIFLVIKIFTLSLK